MGFSRIPINPRDKLAAETFLDNIATSLILDKPFYAGNIPKSGDIAVDFSIGTAFAKKFFGGT